MYSLETGGEEEQQTLNRILQWIKQLPEEPLLSWEFVTTKQNDVLFGMREGPDEPLMDARVLSDGTLRSLAILTALETVQTGSRVILEEFDNGVHPTRVGVLTQALWECSKRRKLNVLVTTHNPATLDALTEPQLDSVLVCYFDHAKKSASVTRLLSLPRSDVLLSRGHLGDLVTRRILEKHLMPNFENEQRQAAADWLSSL